MEKVPECGKTETAAKKVEFGKTKNNKMTKEFQRSDSGGRRGTIRDGIDGHIAKDSFATVFDPPGHFHPPAHRDPACGLGSNWDHGSPGDFYQIPKNTLHQF